jgi:hypothetical protein
MEALAAVDQASKYLNNKSPSPLLAWYLRAIILLGIGTAAIAIAELPDDHLGLVFFGCMAGVAQLGDVELFSNSRSRISVSGVIAVAAILLFGPMAGALIHLFSGLMTAITTTLRSAQPETGRVSWPQRSLFNTSMLVISISLAGWVFASLGGQSGGQGSVIELRSSLVPLICAVTVDTLSNLAILIWVIALQTGRRPAEIWKQDFSWGIPVNVLGGILGGGALALASARPKATWTGWRR